jgi:hypothetical protein
MTSGKEYLQEELSYEVAVTDKEGREIFREGGPSHSYTELWNKIINAHARQSTNTIKDTGGVDRTVGKSTSSLRATAGVGNINYGIRVGKGSTLVDISDYSLEAPVVEGTGPDQLSHHEVQNSQPMVSGPDCSFTIWRVMFNNTGGTVSGIREIGCYVVISGYYGLAFRDVLAGPASIPFGGAMTVTYTLKVTA